MNVLLVRITSVRCTVSEISRVLLVSGTSAKCTGVSGYECFVSLWYMIYSVLFVLMASAKCTVSAIASTGTYSGMLAGAFKYAAFQVVEPSVVPS